MTVYYKKPGKKNVAKGNRSIKGGNKAKLEKRSKSQIQKAAKKRVLARKGKIKKTNIVKGARNPIHVKPFEKI